MTNSSDCHTFCANQSTSMENTMSEFALINAQQYERFNEAVSFWNMIVSLAGIFLNTLNIKTFLSIGVKDGVTTSLLFLSCVDLLTVLTIFSMFMASALATLESKFPLHLPLDPFVIYFFGGNVSVVNSFVIISVVTFITAARCICVSMPLHFRNTFTRKRCLSILVAILITHWAGHMPIFAHMGAQRKFDPKVNSTRLVLWMTEERQSVKDVTRFIFMIPIMIPFIIVDLICVAVIAMKLRQSAIFRRLATSDNIDIKEDDKESNKLTGRDAQVVIQILLVCIILIVCNIPKLVSILLTNIEPRYDIGQPWHYLYLTMSSLTTVFDAINSTVNFFVYFHFNSRFRASLTRMFGRSQ